MQTKIQGNGNIWIENISNDIGVAQIAFTGQGAYGGHTTIAKGAVTFTRGDIFAPSPPNVVTIGSTGGGNATLAAVGGGLGNMENNFVAAANSGGTLIFAANSSLAGAAGNINIKSSSNQTFPPSLVTLNGDLSFDNRATNGSVFVIGDPIVGAGKLTKIGPGPMLVTNTNTYAGGTEVNAGILAVGHADAITNCCGHYTATDGTLGSGDVTVNSTATRLEIESSLAAINVIANTATLSLAGGGSLAFADLGFAELGASINEVVGGLILGGIAQTNPGTYGSSLSGATFQDDEYFSGAGLLTLTPAGQAGDHNGDGIVDAADYVVWRKGLDSSGGAPAGYDAFFENFGEGGAGSGGTAGVPEPTTLVLLGLIVPYALTTRRSRA